MSQEEKSYIAIDLKSFYASVECVERGLDPMNTNLVVADESRTRKTICLAVSPSLKGYGIPGRPRLFQVEKAVAEINAARCMRAPGRRLVGKSYEDTVLKQSPEIALDYIVAPPRMAYYMDYSARIYQIYLKYVAPEDIHVYSIDEVFMDVTSYLKIYKMSARDLAVTIMRDVVQTTGIAATAGVGTNMYLSKVAMDIVAKHIVSEEVGVRVAQLDEMRYRRVLWNHRPITDFWRVGPGYAKKLAAENMFTMGDVARCSLGKDHEYYNEDLLYRLFGVNAELLIDHAWGYEPCTIKDVKAYTPESTSMGSGQVLHCPYEYEKAKLVVREMTELLVLDLVRGGMVTDQLVLTVGYDRENLENPDIAGAYHGEIKTDRYGRKVPKHAHGTINLERQTSSTRLIVEGMMTLYERIVDANLRIRRINMAANHLTPEKQAEASGRYEQLNLFTDYASEEEKRKKEEQALAKEKKLQHAMLEIKDKYGKNAILKGTNLQEGATAVERNGQIGGHKA